ncbi:MAG TPA: hypothetical protein VFH61_04625, partial [Thermoleophilia bacterium]|nr:hypothetical protein [Thermoleophilia bacterium]
SLLTWVIAANVLGRSSDDAGRLQGEAEAEQVATIAARHVELRTTYFNQLVGLLAVEGQLMVGSRTLEQAIQDIPPNLMSAFDSSMFDDDALTADLVKLVDSAGHPVIQLRSSILETAPLNDAELIKATRAGRSTGGIVTTAGQSKAYVVGAALLGVGVGTPPVLLIGTSLTAAMLAETGLSQEDEVFVVGPKGILAATGPTSSDPQWTSLVSSAFTGQATVSGADYIVSSAPIRALGASDMRVVVALPTTQTTALAAAGRMKA